MIFYYLLEYADFKYCLMVVLLLLLLTDIIKNKNPPRFPPGPWPLPFLGNVFTGLHFRTIDKEALVTQLDSFPDRPVIPLFYKAFKGLGVISSNGHLWRAQRKFVVTHLRTFGEAKKNLETSIQQESVFLCDAFKEEGGPFEPHFLLISAVSNIISSLMFGHRFNYHDERFQKILRLDAEAIILSGNPQALLYNAFPRLFEYLPGPHQKIFANYEKIVDFLKDEIKKHKEDWDPSDPRDYIDAYLAEMEKKKSDPEAGFNMETLVVATLDMLEAGSESTATTLRWGLLFMMKYPHIQEKVQAEIDRVIGQSRQPTLDDRANMPYTEAVIHETQRMGNIVPLGFPKKACKDTTLGGYFIPKGTTVTTNLSSVLNDKSEWETPDTFNPGHFMDDQGKFRKRDAFLPFSAGRRSCVGEPLARMELFLFFTSLLQQFTFSPEPGVELSLEGQLGFTYSPGPYRLCVSPR
ncbi:cytochrome P450 2J2-like isoform X2 [Brachyhypopomus gauderio]|uniref:cytochrome P450 2J2-like isoform X2 n=1 Tax=Brachyhypopomus gauderio TaxID=698409 RepID=UPI004042A340